MTSLNGPELGHLVPCHQLVGLELPSGGVLAGLGDDLLHREARLRQDADRWDARAAPVGLGAGHLACSCLTLLFGPDKIGVRNTVAGDCLDHRHRMGDLVSDIQTLPARRDRNKGR